MYKQCAELKKKITRKKVEDDINNQASDIDFEVSGTNLITMINMFKELNDKIENFSRKLETIKRNSMEILELK